jgi:hypothetical protein
MSYAALNAAQVHEACASALKLRVDVGMHSGNHTLDHERLGRVSDLAYHVAAVKGDAADIFVSAEDFALFAGHWPQPQPQP